MNERDFDNIFRKKLEQIPSPSPDDLLWQNIGNQLDSPNLIAPATMSSRWWKAGALALVLALLGSNFYLWKKVETLSANKTNEKNSVKNTISSTTVQHDTIVRYIYIKEKSEVRNDILTSNNNLKLKTNHFDSSNTQILDKPNTPLNTTATVANNSKLLPTAINLNIQKETIAEQTKVDNTAKTVESTTNITQNQVISTSKNENNSEIINQENIENKDLTTQKEETTGLINVKENRTDSSNTQIGNYSNTPLNQKNHSDSSKTQRLESSNAQLFSKIEPVKERKLARWAVGLNTFGGGIEEKGAEGHFLGIGINLSTNFSPKWRIASSIDGIKMNYENRFGKNYWKHEKPDKNPDEKYDRWQVDHQPFVQWNIGVERVFKIKKFETFIGVGTGLTVTLPHEIRYKGENTVTNMPVISKSEVDKAYTTLSGIQFSAGVNYPIYKKISATLSTHYQRSINSEKIYWENLISGKLGLKYSF